MSEARQYHQMVMYIEACESGSLFEPRLFPGTMNVYVISAANPTESSWACYYNSTLETYLGDTFSCMWLEGRFL